MTAFSRTVALVMLLSASARAAEHDWPAPPRAKGAEDWLSLSVSNRAGLVKAPFFTTAFPEVSGFGDVLTPVAAAHLSSIGWLRVSLPVSIVRLDFPGRAQVSETALGNLELGLEHGIELSPSTRWALLAALLVPTAEHGTETALLDNRALALANALDGGKDSPRFTPGITGVRLGASIEHWRPPFGFRAGLELPLLVRLSDASLPDETETHSVAILPALELRTAWWVTRWFGASLAGTLLTEPLRIQEPTLDRDRRRRVQPILEPGVHFRLGQHFALGLDASIPVAGTLGGDAWSVGLHARFGL